jgi:hypothetical protein
MPEVGVRYNQIRTTRMKTVRVCAHCQARQEVDVLGVGHGSGDASHLLGNYDAARARAGTAAQNDAERKARLMLGLVHCPKCGLRDAAVTRRFVAGVIGKCVGIGLIAAFAGFFILHSASGMAMLLGAVVAAALSVAIYFWAVGPLDALKQASMCVKFLGEAGQPNP